MGDSVARITRIEMPDGTPVWARISGAEELDGPAPGSGPTYTDTGFGDIADQVQARVESLHSVVTSVARSLAVPLRAVRPDEVSVEFGIELTAKSGRIVGLLADGEAKGAIKVTLTWNGGGPPVDPPPCGPRTRPRTHARPRTRAGPRASGSRASGVRAAGSVRASRGPARRTGARAPGPPAGASPGAPAHPDGAGDTDGGGT